MSKSQLPWFAILCLLAILFVIARILTVHPHLFYSKLYPLPTARMSALWPPVHFVDPLPQATPPVAMYRVNGERSGRYHVAHLPHGFRQIWQTSDINLGVHDASKSSPVSDGSTVYVGGDDSWFHALAVESGQEKWRFLVGQSDRGIHSTAAIDGSGVYLGSYAGTIYKLDRNTGSLIWLRQVGNTIGASPFIDEKALVVSVETFFPADGFLLKLDRTTGALIWQTELLGQQSHSSPAYDQSRQLFFAGTNGSEVKAFDASTGRTVWTASVGGQVKSTPLLVKDLVVITDLGQEVLALDKATGQVRWRAPLSDKSQTTPTELKRLSAVVVSDRRGELRAFGETSGQALWSLPFPSPHQEIQRSSPVVLEDAHGQELILFTCTTQALCLISPSGKELMRFPLPGPVSSVPWVEGDRIFISIDRGGVVGLEMIYMR